MSNMSWAKAKLDQIIAAGPNVALVAVGDADQKPFQDSDGLISFVNLASVLVTSKDEYTTGRQVLDRVCNFFSTVRINTFHYLQQHPEDVPQGDSPPKDQWDKAVTDYIQSLLV